ncbi:MAG: glycosyltransferase family 39 protein [Anaerolineae bacterium]|nr:glycosyltransferase family 39 protein [Anaerolineae bacterium]
MSKNRNILTMLVGVLLVYFFAFHNLTRFPSPWFDEGSHLHVPKTLVRYGEYADISSEGFRYYGPTIGVGPTVMLPIAAVFKLFGIGLLQARLVMAFYLLAAIYAFYLLTENLAGKAIASIALILMLSSRGVLFLEYGRQLLGEVPGFFFLMLGLYLWFSKWNESESKRLALVGLLLGLAMITKYQYLLFIAPTLIISWALDVFYYKTSSHRNFLVPGIVAAVSFGIWQLIMLLYLGPDTVAENLALLRASAEGTAFNFNPTQLGVNVETLSARSVYLEALLPALIYGFFISIPRTRDAQKRSVIFLLVILNLIWFVAFSIGWIRYAFLGLALSSIFIAQFFHNLTNGFQFDWSSGYFRSFFVMGNASRFTLALWLVAIVMAPLAKTMVDIAFPGPNHARLMADYMNENIPQSAIIETWDPEMGFFTDHNYHYPPNALLAVAVEHINYGGEPVQKRYDFLQTEEPDYLLIGEFSKWTEVYSNDIVHENYQLWQSFGVYDLYRRLEK